PSTYATVEQCSTRPAAQDSHTAQAGPTAQALTIHADANWTGKPQAKTTVSKPITSSHQDSAAQTTPTTSHRYAASATTTSPTEPESQPASRPPPTSPPAANGDPRG